MSLLKNVISISRVFDVKVNDAEYNYIKTSKYLGECISKITFLCVELEEYCSKRSEVINSLTKLLSKIYNNPIVVIYKQKGYIAISGQLSFKDNEEEVTEIFLSDWYSVNNMNQASSYKLSLMKYEYQNDNNILDFYSDLMFSISREYQINPESYEYIKYQVFPPTEDEPYYLNLHDIFQNMNHCKEYGDDYIFDYNNEIEHHEGLVIYYFDIEDLEQFDGEPSNDDGDEKQYVEDEVFIKLGYISDVEYDDPEKLLELINNVEK